jgi:hypothetical protein
MVSISVFSFENTLTKIKTFHCFIKNFDVFLFETKENQAFFLFFFFDRQRLINLSFCCDTQYFIQSLCFLFFYIYI